MGRLISSSSDYISRRLTGPLDYQNLALREAPEREYDLSYGCPAAIVRPVRLLNRLRRTNLLAAKTGEMKSPFLQSLSGLLRPQIVHPAIASVSNIDIL